MSEPEGKSVYAYEPSMANMSLRDWFAGQALAGLMALPVTGGDTPLQMFAKASYEMADAMLEERAK